MEWPASCGVHFSHVPRKNQLAREAEQQGLLESEDHHHKPQLPNELHGVEPGCSASKLR